MERRWSRAGASSLIVRKTNGRIQEERTYLEEATGAVERVNSMEREELLSSLRGFESERDRHPQRG